MARDQIAGKPLHLHQASDSLDAAWLMLRTHAEVFSDDFKEDRLYIAFLFRRGSSFGSSSTCPGADESPAATAHDAEPTARRELRESWNGIGRVPRHRPNRTGLRREDLCDEGAGGRRYGSAVGTTGPTEIAE